jgi:hypothetical protein
MAVESKVNEVDRSVHVLDRPVVLLKRHSVVGDGCDPTSTISNAATIPAL